MKTAWRKQEGHRRAGIVLFLLSLLLLILLVNVAVRKGHIEIGEMRRLLGQALIVCGFSLSSAVAAELMSLPFCVALALSVTMIAPDRIRKGLERIASGLSAIPAVVLGYMSLKFYASKLASPWWAVVVTLLLMSLMEQTMDFIRINGRQSALMERARALGANWRETALVFVFPQVKKSYLRIAISTLVRDLSEGVAILLVLSYYEKEADTLSTAIMKAVGVIGDGGNAVWVILLVLLLLLISEIIRLLSGRIREGREGR